MALKIRKGDKVIVITGSNKGTVSEIKAISGDMAILDNVNMKKKHIKKTRNEAGRIESFAAPINVSNLAHVIDGKPIKVKFVVESDGKFIVDKKTGTRIRKV